MLILSRKLGEAVRIGEAEVKILRVGASGVRIGIEAPGDVPIVRTELPEKPAGGSRREAAVARPRSKRLTASGDSA